MLRGMSMQLDRARATAEIPPEATLRINIQVFADRVWCGVYWATHGGGSVPIYSQSFDRPEGKTMGDCVDRALAKAESNLPPSFDNVRSAREAW
jgi:hypothetical protein